MGGKDSKPIKDSEVHLNDLVKKAVEERSRKVHETKAAEAARDKHLQDVIRGVIKETLVTIPPGNLTQDLASRNVHMEQLLQKVTAIADNDPTKMMNLFLDLQQQLGSNANKIGSPHADVAVFIQKQLESMQAVKITVEKKPDATMAPRNLDWIDLTDHRAFAGASNAENSTASPLPTYGQNRGAVPSQTLVGQPLIHHHEQPSSQDVRPTENTKPTFGGEHLHQRKPFPGNVPFQNKPSFHCDETIQAPLKEKPLPPQLQFNDSDLFKSNGSFQDLISENKPSSEDLFRNNKVFKEKPIPDKTPFESSRLNLAKKPIGPFLVNKPSNNQGPSYKNGPPPNGRPFLDNGPFLDRGPCQGRDYNLNKFPNNPPTPVLNNQEFQKPTPLMSQGFQNRGRAGFPKRGSRQNQESSKEQKGFGEHRLPNRGKFEGSGRGQGHFRGHGYTPNPDGFNNNGQNQYHPSGMGFGPDPRRSQSPHQTRDQFQNREYQGRPYYTNANSESPRDENFPHPRNHVAQNTHRMGRGNFHSQNSLLGDFPQNQDFNQGPGHDHKRFPGQQREGIFPHSGRGNVRGQMPGGYRGNNLNPSHRSRSQSISRNYHQSQEKLDNLAKCESQEKLNCKKNLDSQEKSGYVGFYGPRSEYRGQGAFPKSRGNPAKKLQKGAKEKKQKEPVKQNAKKIESQKNSKESGAESEDNESVTQATQNEDLEAVTSADKVTSGGVLKKPKRKMKAKKTSSATSVSTSQNDNVSENKQPVMASGGEKQEASNPVQLFLGQGFNLEAARDMNPNEKMVESILCISKVDGDVKSCNPQTVGELLAFKIEHPNAEFVVIK